MAPRRDCFAWISYLWIDHFNEQDKFVNFPDDLTIEILARLPADDVIKCRRVCKSWKSLTSTPSFIDLHLKRATTTTPSLFLQVRGNFFTGDEYGHKKLKEYSKSALKKLNDYIPNLVGYSCNGLLLFQSCVKAIFDTWFLFEPRGIAVKYFVINPITQEQVSFDTPHPITSATTGWVCAIFFHPSTRDYKVLYWLYHHDNNNKYQYFTYSLRARTWKQISSFSFLPDVKSTSIGILNGCLHWIVAPELNPEKNNTILIYNTDREDFRAMPHPGDECRSNEMNEFVTNKMNLLKINERLTFFRSNRMAIEIWVLEDYEKWGWVKQQEVLLESPIEYKVIGFQNNELLLGGAGLGVFLCKLKSNRIKMVETTKLSRDFEHWGETVAYTKSLVSPVNV